MSWRLIERGGYGSNGNLLIDGQREGLVKRVRVKDYEHGVGFGLIVDREVKVGSITAERCSRSSVNAIMRNVAAYCFWTNSTAAGKMRYVKGID